MTLLFFCDSSYRECINKQLYLFSNKTLFSASDIMASFVLWAIFLTLAVYNYNIVVEMKLFRETIYY